MTLSESATPEEAKPRSRKLAVGGVVILAALLMAFLAVGLARGKVESVGNILVPEGQRTAAKELRLPLLADGPLGPAGTVVDLATLKGRPVILNFWASWCEPCRQESKTLNALAVSAGKRGVVTLGVNGRDVREDALAFLRDERTPYSSVRDPSERVKDRWGVSKFPETFVIDRQGRVAAHAGGGINEPELGRLIVRAVEGVI